MEPTSHDKVIDLRRVKKDETSPAKSSPSIEEAQKPKYKEGSILYQWEAPEFTKYQKDPYWKPSLIVATIIIAAFFIITKNYLGAVVMGLLGFLVYVYAFKEPGIVNLAITPKGITIDKKLYSFEDLSSFWMFYEPPHLKEISLKSKKVSSPYTCIPLGKANPIEIRKLLLDFIPEKKQEEPIANILARRLKF